MPQGKFLSHTRVSVPRRTGQPTAMRGRQETQAMDHFPNTEDGLVATLEALIIVVGPFFQHG